MDSACSSFSDSRTRDRTSSLVQSREQRSGILPSVRATSDWPAVSEGVRSNRPHDQPTDRPTNQPIYH